DVFSIPAHATASGKDVAIEKLPWITEHDVMAFSPYPAQNATFGALVQFDDHGRTVLDTLSVERRGGFLFVLINGRMITELRIDKRVSDGKIYVPSGLTAADVELMKKQWRSPGERKRAPISSPMRLLFGVVVVALLFCAAITMQTAQNQVLDL